MAVNNVRPEVLQIIWKELILKESIGGGGFSSVNKACWREEVVAVKAAHIQPGISLKLIEKSVRYEAGLIQQLKHPNIISLFGVCVEHPYYCLVLEYCAGGSLKNVFAQYKLSVSMALNWAIQIGQGICYLHGQTPPLVHRDIKSSNVLLKNLISTTVILKIADFGFTRKTDHTTEMSGFKGTPAYIAPEIITKQHFSKASDIWSYGILIWELTNNEVAYKNVHPHQIYYGVGKNILFLTVPNIFSQPLKKILKSCWKRNPHKRPSCSKLLKIIELVHQSLQPSDFDSQMLLEEGQFDANTLNMHHYSQL